MAHESGGFCSSIPGILTGAAALIAAVTGAVVAMNHSSPSPSPSPSTGTIDRPVVVERPVDRPDPKQKPRAPVHTGSMGDASGRHLV